MSMQSEFTILRSAFRICLRHAHVLVLCTPLVNGCVDDVLFNAVPNVQLN